MCSHKNRLIEAILMSKHNIPFKYKIENHPNLSQICKYGIFSKGLKNEFETAVVNKPSVFEPLRVYCIACCFYLCLSLFRIASQIATIRHSRASLEVALYCVLYICMSILLCLYITKSYSIVLNRLKLFSRNFIHIT